MPAGLTIDFAKYHGLGNDFMIVDLRGVSAEVRDAAQGAAFVRAACDRQFGVGGDGVLALLSPVSPGADARMRVLNADGSEAEMCGNGLRCVAKFLHDRGGLHKPELLIDTGAGALRCTLEVVDGVVATVTVDMGQPRLSQPEIPMETSESNSAARCIEERVNLGREMVDITAVSMGNPHAVVFVDSRQRAENLAREVGTKLEHHAWFPRRTNAEFAHVRASGEIDLIVWERGCGITLACGTGACATVVAACLTARAQVGREVMVHLLGGALAITVEHEYRTVFMRGPARHVFDGTLAIAAVIAGARPLI
ncbi:MAG: diaminopimelate epimerase [Kofleriaceae bacterium]|nr:diaminopimelate epimerase [Kofleriaceae bacterium]